MDLLLVYYTTEYDQMFTDICGTLIVSHSYSWAVTIAIQFKV